MKKIFILVVGLFICTTTFAQETVSTEQAVPYKVYCEIITRPRVFSTKVDVELDFGQSYKFWSGDRHLYDENGQRIEFNSMLDAANYMARRGWELEVAFPVTHISGGDSSSTDFHWILYKLVTNDSQITEGITTGSMLKQ